MLFPTMAFGLFFLFVFFVSWSLDRENGRRKLFLLLASWFFYAQWDWRFVGLLIASAVLNWAVAAAIASTEHRTRRGWLVALGVLINLLILGFFKYYGFFVEQAGELLRQFGWERDLPLLQVVLPVGISFFTFQGICYVVDVHRRKTPAACVSPRRWRPSSPLWTEGGPSRSCNGATATRPPAGSPRPFAGASPRSIPPA